ncbi:chemotaxis protein CheB [Croceicoccus mobilis]|uniref:Chemotaxis protein CheR n=1 Tax=Croceicoccus mobilis TaxID=1703339 RepID=A0A916Z0S8_9SPHN|nr:chemotaxis protein CheB [Croceicoccus mobilis]GGD70067.1 chemotaxis protein CheR [Croceicoccus mobilis]
MAHDSATDVFPIIGIGASAGGLEALRETLQGYQGRPGMAFVIVQHLDPTHESMMAQLIERYTNMPVKQIEGGEKIEIDHVYVIPPGSGLEIDNGVLQLTEFATPRGMRRPIDDFFESLGEDQGAMAACIILSGTGADGSRGLRAVKENGGLAIAQEPQSARYDGMPLSAVGTGLVDFVEEPEAIIACLRNFFDRRKQTGEASGEAVFVADHVNELCATLRETVGHDFSGYKRSTLSRRIQRRMQVLGIGDGEVYLNRIRTDKDECQALFRDLLINVTRFFRDPDAFRVLNDEVIEPMVSTARDSDELRVWVPGCSSGEEAYTIAMLFHAARVKYATRPIINIFASDIDDQMLQLARAASYPVSHLPDIPEPLRSNYTVGHGETFTICEPVRDMIRFSSHSVIKDPPFSKIDLVSCRNLLIYFDDRLQQTVIPLFHYSLKSSGYLFLGPSESVTQFDDLFEPADQRVRLFRRKNGPRNYSLDLPAPTRKRARRRTQDDGDERSQSWVEGEALRRAQTYAPATLLVDKSAGLINSWGRVGRYLEFPNERERRLYVPSLAKPGLREALGGLIRQTATDDRKRIARDVEVKTDFGTQPVNVICEPVSDGTMLVVIRETGNFRANDEEEFLELTAPDDQVHLLEEELRRTRHRLRTTVEELETANEELKSSNEEMMSMNEELQSTNEELTTVNDELKTKVDQLTVANSDLKNFFDSTQLAVVVLDKDLCIRSFTDAAKTLFPFQPGDKGRALIEVSDYLQSKQHIELARTVASTGETQDARVTDASGDRVFALRAVPYRKADGSLDGATLIFTDVTQALTMESELISQRERLKLAVEVARIGIWEYDPSTGETALDDTQRALLSIDRASADQISNVISRIHEDDRADVEEALRRTISSGEEFDESYRVKTNDGSYRWIRSMGRMVDKNNKRTMAGVAFDITSERSSIEQRELLLREMNHRIKNLFAVVGGMISISRRDAETVDGFAEDLRGRVGAMNRAHGLTQQSVGDDPVVLEELIDTVIAPSAGNQQIRVNGPRVIVPIPKLTPLALILHEWATNAAKYGALSHSEGTLEVVWTNEDNKVELAWNETGTVGSDKPNPAGFGTRLIEASSRQLDASVEGEQGDGFFRRKLIIPGLDQPG